MLVRTEMNRDGVDLGRMFTLLDSAKTAADNLRWGATLGRGEIPHQELRDFAVLLDNLRDEAREVYNDIHPFG